MRYVSNPTADHAIGSVDRETRQLVQLARRVRKGGEAAIRKYQPCFTGIYREMLTCSEEELDWWLDPRGRK